MRCPSCGAIIKKKSIKCSECGATQNENSINSQLAPVAVAETAAKPTEKKTKKAKSPALIEFPGVNRSVPQWRKELGERVREVQDRRAREAAFEAGQIIEQSPDTVRTAPLLELIPQAAPEPVNPIVAAALQRIERAHTQPQFSGNAAVATYVDYYEQPQVELEDPTPATGTVHLPIAEENVKEPSPPPERVHNLAVVPSPIVTEVESRTEPRPKRLILDDLNDPALNYLDSVQTKGPLELREHRSAPIAFRLMSGIADLIVMSLLAFPVIALVQLSNLPREDVRVIAFAIGAFLVVGFLYLTISTALTGRTCGMRLFGLRVLDSRTGLIPTGAQAAGRSFIYMLSIVSAGIVFLWTLIDRERRSAHDKFSRTAVVNL